MISQFFFHNQGQFAVMALIWCKRCGRTDHPYNTSKNGPHIHKKFLYFFIVAPGRRWYVKKSIFLKKKTASQAADFFFFKITNVLGQYKVLHHALDHPIMAPINGRFYFLRILCFHILKMASATFFQYTKQWPSLCFLHQAPLFVRPSLLICTPSKKSQKAKVFNANHSKKGNLATLSQSSVN